MVDLQRYIFAIVIRETGELLTTKDKQTFFNTSDACCEYLTIHGLEPSDYDVKQFVTRPVKVKIGDILRHNKKTYVAVESTHAASCEGCDMYKHDHDTGYLTCPHYTQDSLLCSSSTIFVMIEE